jgi:hypothetical protein
MDREGSRATQKERGMDELRPMANDDLKYKTYLEERKSLIDAKLAGSLLFDKAILALAGGAFGLSLTFIRPILPDIRPWTLTVLQCAWIGFGVSLLSTLISVLASQSACARQVEILEAELRDDNLGHKKCDLENRPANWTGWLNKLSIGTFIIGAALLAIFVSVNLVPKKESTMSEEKKGNLQEGFVPPPQPKTPEEIKKGFVPPKPPAKKEESPPQQKPREQKSK